MGWGDEQAKGGWDWGDRAHTAVFAEGVRFELRLQRTQTILTQYLVCYVYVCMKKTTNDFVFVEQLY